MRESFFSFCISLGLSLLKNTPKKYYFKLPACGPTFNSIYIYLQQPLPTQPIFYSEYCTTWLASVVSYLCSYVVPLLINSSGVIVFNTLTRVVFLSDPFTEDFATTAAFFPAGTEAWPTAPVYDLSPAIPHPALAAMPPHIQVLSFLILVISI